MILLMGLPGSGKGTQGKMLADQKGLHLISMGELVRLYVTGERRQRMLAGELLEDKEVIDILDRVLKTLPDDEECILDGFPRTIPQAEWLLEQVRQGRFAISQVLHLAAGHEAVKQRLRARGRIDDQEAVIAERFKEYERLTEPLLEWFAGQGIKVVNINAEQSVEKVNQDMVKCLDHKA